MREIMDREIKLSPKDVHWWKGFGLNVIVVMERHKFSPAMTMSLTRVDRALKHAEFIRR